MDGETVFVRHYEPYGESSSTGQDETDVGYAGHLTDASSGLVYAGARWYQPGVSRFLGPDPVGPEQSFNRYIYANNNPYLYTDPDGRNVVSFVGGVLVETGHLITGEETHYGALGGALVDGYNGEGQGVVAAAVEDAASFLPAAGALGVAGKLSKIVKIVTRTVEGAEGATKGTKRNPNKLESAKDAEGPHSSFRRDAGGRVSNYETYDNNPHTGEWTASKRFRGSGKEHGGVEPPLVLERAAGKGPGSKPVVPRKPEPFERPKGY